MSGVRHAVPPVLVSAVRDGIDESQHRGHVVVATADRALVATLGQADHPTYIRSAAKPFQAAAVLEILDAAGVVIDEPGLAIASASHVGSARHRAQAAGILATAGLDVDALQCPATLPDGSAPRSTQQAPSPLAHNCSGKHAGFLLAQVTLGDDPATYLDPHCVLQQRVRARLESATACGAVGPGVDGCGAPAWVLPLRGLASGFARLAAGADTQLRRIRDAMTAHPDLVGGEDTVDAMLMRADERVVAKRGAEGVLAAGIPLHGSAPVGVAVKIADGSPRATAPVMATVLRALGAEVPEELAAPVILGGGQPHGLLRAEQSVAALLP